jgi:hypothetical protein
VWRWHCGRGAWVRMQQGGWQQGSRQQAAGQRAARLRLQVARHVALDQGDGQAGVGGQDLEHLGGEAWAGGGSRGLACRVEASMLGRVNPAAAPGGASYAQRCPPGASGAARGPAHLQRRQPAALLHARQHVADLGAAVARLARKVLQGGGPQLRVAAAGGVPVARARADEAAVVAVVHVHLRRRRRWRVVCGGGGGGGVAVRLRAPWGRLGRGTVVHGSSLAKLRPAAQNCTTPTPPRPPHPPTPPPTHAPTHPPTHHVTHPPPPPTPPPPPPRRRPPAAPPCAGAACRTAAPGPP